MIGTGRAERPRRGVASLVIGIAMLLAGLAFMLYPTVSAVMAQAQIDASLEDMLTTGDTAQDADEVQGKTDETSTVGHATAEEKAADPTYQKLVVYNASVRAGEAGEVNDPFTFTSDKLAELGLPDGIVGSVSVPAMGVTIPLYLGATEKHMVDGAGVIAGTSAPLGETDSNCVIAAHRGGYHGLAMFRDIECLTEGDLVQIETPWDTLTYAVREVEVVEPSDVSAVAVRPRQDLVTLLTCHPYGTNSYRLLVICERVADVDVVVPLVSAVAAHLAPDLTSDSPLLVLEGILRLVGLCVLVVLGVYLVVQELRRGRRVRAGFVPPPVERQGRHFKP